MVDPAVYLTAALALLFGLFKIAAGHGARAHSEAPSQIGFTLCMSAHLALAAPATVALIVRLDTPAAGAFGLFDDELGIGAIHYLALLALALLPPGDERRRARVIQHRAVIATAAAAAVLFAAARAETVGDDLVVRGAGKLALAAYGALLSGYIAWCLCTVALKIIRFTRGIAPGTLLTGTRLILAGAATGLFWTAWNLFELLPLLRTGRTESGADAGDALLGAVGIALGLGGAVLVTCESATRGPASWLRCYRQYRELEHLWSALRTAVPEIVLAPAAGRFGPDLPLDSEFALHRRVIEIYDGCLALRPHLHPRALHWAAAMTASDERTAATVEAAVIAAAIEAADLGYRAPGDPAPFPAPADLSSTAEETAWLIEVADAFRNAPAVDRVRHLVRSDLSA